MYPWVKVVLVSATYFEPRIKQLLQPLHLYTGTTFANVRFSNSTTRSSALGVERSHVRTWKSYPSTLNKDFHWSELKFVDRYGPMI